MREVAFLPEAEADLRTALAWYAERSEQAAAGFDAAVEVALRAIAETPERWTRCDPRHRFYVLRRYPYSIVYRIEAEGILVVAVPHSHRSPESWSGRT